MKGIAACVRCAGRGQVRAWLEVRVRRLGQVRARPKAAAVAHPRLLDAGDFDCATWPFDLVDDHMIGADVELDVELRADIDARSDRVISSRVQTFDARAVRVTYATKQARAGIVLIGEPLRFAAPPTLHPLVRRQHTVLGVLAGGGILAAGIWTAYAVRHEFYWRFGHGGLVFLAAIFAGVLAAVVASELLLVRKARSAALTRGSLALSLVGALVTATLFEAGAPSVRGARAALTAKDFTRATVEARGLVDLGIDVGGGGDVLDAIHSAEVTAASSLEMRARLYRAPWYSPAASALVRELVSRQAREEARRAYHAEQAGVLDAVRNAVGGIDPSVDPELDGLALLLAARECIRKGHFDCAVTAFERAAKEPSIEAERSVVEHLFSTELGRELDAKVAAGRSTSSTKLDRARSYDRAIALAVLRGKRGEPEMAAPLATLRAEAAVVLLAAKAEEKVAAQREAAQRAAEERRAAAESARDANRPLLCCDGAASPTCSCEGSHRGCCSHHGGVCGCVGR